MVTQAQVSALVGAYADNDRERFKSITLQISADAMKAGQEKFSESIKRQIGQSNTLIPLPMESEKVLSQERPKRKLNELLLDPGIRTELDEVIREWKSRPKLRERGLDARRHLLFLGPPGTGKTASAGALADALELPLFVAKLDGVISSFMGETGKRLRDLFNAIKTVPGVYLIDEFDALGSTRRNRNRGTTDHQEIHRALNALLQFLEEDGLGMVVAATNLDPVLDKAVWRRFHVVLKYRLPSPAEIQALVHQTISKAGLELDFVFEWEEVLEASLSLSHAEIEEATRGAARGLVLDGKPTITSLQVAERLRKVHRAEEEE